MADSSSSSAISSPAPAAVTGEQSVAAAGSAASSTAATLYNAPAPEPVVTSAPAAEPVATPQPTPAPSLAPEPAATPQPTPAPTADPASVLGEAGKKPDEADPAATAPPAPLVYDFKLPEGVTADEPSLNLAKEVFTKYETKPEAAQELLNMHYAEFTKYAESLAQQQHDTWRETNDSWKSETYKAFNATDAKSFAETEVNQRVGSLIDQFGKDIPTLRQDLTLTGAGNKLSFVKFFDNIAKAFTEGKVVNLSESREAQQGLKTKPTSKATTLYDNKGV